VAGQASHMEYASKFYDSAWMCGRSLLLIHDQKQCNVWLLRTWLWSPSLLFAWHSGCDLLFISMTEIIAMKALIPDVPEIQEQLLTVLHVIPKVSSSNYLLFYQLRPRTFACVLMLKIFSPPTLSNHTTAKHCKVCHLLLSLFNDTF
jgi:hypothetical protein